MLEFFALIGIYFASKTTPVTQAVAVVKDKIKTVILGNQNVSEWPVLPQSISFETWQNVISRVDTKFFDGWFADKNLIKLCAAMVMVESSGGTNLERKVSARDTSYGVMQVTPYTAADIYNRGYQLLPPTREVLLTSLGGLYYGMSYVKILYEVYKIRGNQNLTQAYNGGAGVFYSKYYKSVAKWQQAYNNTLEHWNKINEYV